MADSASSTPFKAGDVVYFTLAVADADRAQRFYGELLGWSFSPGNAPGGSNIEGATPPGGMMEGAEAGAAELYFMVDDLDAGMARVLELGGEAGDPQPTDGGRYSRCRDDQGNAFGIWAPGG